MNEANTFNNDCKVYRIKGLSCAGCAKTFENNVKEIEGVVDAKVNFGAAKITVVGDVDIKLVQKAGDFGVNI